MARRARRLWSDEEKRSICFQTVASGVSVAQVARRHAMNANMIFTWLRDPRYAPEIEPAAEAYATDAANFLPVGIVGRHQGDADLLTPDPAPGTIKIDVAGGHRLRVVGAYDPEVLARLIQGLSP